MTQMSLTQFYEFVHANPTDGLRPARKRGYICEQPTARGICNNGTGGDGDGISLVPGSSGQLHCFKCGFSGDRVAYEAGKQGLDPKSIEAAKATAEVYGIEIDGSSTQTSAHAPKKKQEPKPEPEPPAPRADFREYLSKCHAALMASPEAQAYLTGRGITKESMERFKLGYDAKCYNKPLEKKIPSIVIPYGRDGHYYITRPLTEKKYDKPSKNKAGEEPLYNAACLYKGDAAAVFVVESQMCAISIMQEGGAAVAIGGTGSKKLLDQITAQPTQKTLILCLDKDPDGTGQGKQADLAAELTSRGVSFIEYSVCGDHKDPNEFLQADRAAFAEAVKNGMNAPEAQKEAQRQEKAYQFKAKYSAAGRIHDFMEGIDASIHNPPQPTGFQTLDKILDGGLYAGYVIVTGGTSVGKTSLCLQIADNVAAAGRDVLYFTLEMTAADLMARSISRLTYKNCGGRESNAKITRAITDATKREKYTPAEEKLVNESTWEYVETIAQHLCFIEPCQLNKDFLSTDDIKGVLENYAEGMEPGAQGPLVIVDYAQLLRPSDTDKTSDVRQNVSNTATVLYHLSKQYNIPIISITSLPRSEYTQRDTMTGGKESGDLDYTAEYLFRLQFPAPPKVKKGRGNNAQMVDQEYTPSYDKEQRKKDPRTVELAIMKNRSGPTGDTVTFNYYAKFNHFEEAGHALDDVD